MKLQEDSECTIYYKHHISSRVGAIVTTLMLSVLLVLFIVGRFTLDYSALHIPEKEEVRVVAMKIHSIKDNQIEAIVHDTQVQKKRVFRNNVKQPKKVHKKQKPITQKTVPLSKPLQSTETLPEDAILESTANGNEESQEATSSASLPQAVEENNPTEVEKATAALLSAIEKYKSYPRAARRAGYQGVVHISVELTTRGTIASYRLHQSSGYELLDKATLEAMNKLIGKQITKANLVVPVEVVIPIRYALES